MKKSLFRPGLQYFHINLDFTVHPIFRELDWIFVQKKIQPLLERHDINLHALVMMDTHLHLLIRGKNGNENFFCEKLIENLKTNHSSVDCHCEPIENYPQYLNAYKYIYRNPLEAGLARSVEDYTYSSLRGLLGLAVSHCEIIDHLGLIQNPVHLLKWLNNEGDFKHSKLSQFAERSVLN